MFTMRWRWNVSKILCHVHVMFSRNVPHKLHLFLCFRTRFWNWGVLPVTMVTNNKQRGVPRRTVWKIRVTVANWCVRWKLLLAPYLLASQVTLKFYSKQAPVFYYLRLMNKCKFRVKVASSALDPSHWQI